MDVDAMISGPGSFFAHPEKGPVARPLTCSQFDVNTLPRGVLKPYSVLLWLKVALQGDPTYVGASTNSRAI